PPNCQSSRQPISPVCTIGSNPRLPRFALSPAWLVYIFHIFTGHGSNRRHLQIDVYPTVCVNICARYYPVQPYWWRVCSGHCTGSHGHLAMKKKARLTTLSAEPYVEVCPVRNRTFLGLMNDCRLRHE
ncbi:unnamed protein product, partial [Ectocarpus sp. 6 AP-2014]